MKNVDYSKFYGERFCLKCERLLKEDQIHIHVCQNPDTPDISFLKTKTFECKECRPRQLARKFDHPFWRFIKVYFLQFVIHFWFRNHYCNKSFWRPWWEMAFNTSFALIFWDGIYCVFYAARKKRNQTAHSENSVKMRKTIFKIACVFVGALFTLFGLSQLWQGNMSWTELPSSAGRKNMPMSLFSILLGPFLIYAGITGYGLRDGD